MNEKIIEGLAKREDRLGRRATDITELTRRIEGLEEKQCNLYADRVFVVNGLAQRVNVLAGRVKKLGVEQVGNDRTFRKLISDKVELAHRVEELEGGVSLLETICDLREQRLVSAVQEHTKLAEELDEAALELARHIGGLRERAKNALHERVRAEAERDKLAERIEQLERLLEREES